MSSSRKGKKTSKGKKRSQKKICNCSETCGKLLSERQRRRHYRDAGPLTRCPSESPPPSASSSDSHSDVSMDYTPTLPSDWTPASFDNDDAMDDEEDPDLPSSDPESDFELDPEDAWIDFDEGQERTECTGREQMLRELEEMLSPAEEAELWADSVYLSY